MCVCVMFVDYEIGKDTMGEEEDVSREMGMRMMEWKREIGGRKGRGW